MSKRQKVHGMIRAVLDTNVLLPRSTRSELREQAAIGRFTAIWSPWIIAELYRTLTWHWLVADAPRRQTAAGTTMALCEASKPNRDRCAEMANRMRALLHEYAACMPAVPEVPRWRTG